MKILLSGSDKEVQKVMRENRIREARGLIKFEPVPAEEVAEPETDTKEPVTDTKEPETDTKAPKKSTKK